MATRTTSKSNKSGTGYGVSNNSVSSRDVGGLDKSNHSAVVALIAAATAVVALLIVAPPLIGMYIDTDRNNHAVEVRDKQWTVKVEKLEDMIKYNEQLLKEIKNKTKE